jgi:hypothetical protein
MEVVHISTCVFLYLLRYQTGAGVFGSSSSHKRAAVFQLKIVERFNLATWLYEVEHDCTV